MGETVKKHISPVTINEARLRLGRKGESLTDKQIGEFLTLLRGVCNRIVDSVVETRI